MNINGGNQLNQGFGSGVKSLKVRQFKTGHVGEDPNGSFVDPEMDQQKIDLDDLGDDVLSAKNPALANSAINFPNLNPKMQGTDKF